MLSTFPQGYPKCTGEVRARRALNHPGFVSNGSAPHQVHNGHMLIVPGQSQCHCTGVVLLGRKRKAILSQWQGAVRIVPCVLVEEQGFSEFQRY